MFGLLAVWLVTAISLFVVSRLDIGIDIDDFGTALWAALAVGLVNGLLGPIAQILFFPLTLLTLGLFVFVINALLFWLASQFVDGFRLTNGFVSALIGSILISVLNGLIFWIV